jgi:hypothetical protein
LLGSGEARLPGGVRGGAPQSLGAALLYNAVPFPQGFEGLEFGGAMN